MANEAYRAVFLRVHPTGKMVLSLTTEADGNEGRYAQIVADELGVPALDVKVVPADENRFGTGHGFNTSPSDGTPGAIVSATGKIKAKAQLLAGVAMDAPPDSLRWDNGAFVRAGKAGAASKAGHNLVIEVTSWQATLDLPEGAGERSLTLTADPASLRVREGSGGAMPLGDDDKASIAQTIDAEVLRGGAIAFRSRSVEAGPDGAGLRVEGDLDLVGATRPVAFHLDADADGRLTGRATLKQSDWGI